MTLFRDTKEIMMKESVNISCKVLEEENCEETYQDAIIMADINNTYAR